MERPKNTGENPTEPQSPPPIADSSDADTNPQLSSGAQTKPGWKSGQGVSARLEINPSLKFLYPPRSEGEIGWLDHYRIKRVLGTGGMGIVLEAEDTHLRRLVAIKVIRPELATDLPIRQRFIREARAMAAIDHPNVISVYQVGLFDLADGSKLPMFVMPLLQGETLEARLVRQEKLLPAEVVIIGWQIADALATIHERGTIHRDIKLANIWLCAPDAQVKLLDFGLARAYNDAMNLSTAAGTMLGTPLFMSPEQIQGKTLDNRSDLFSLGTVLYTTLTGDLPFDGDDLNELMTLIVQHNPTPPRDKVRGVPAELNDLIVSLLQKDPANRPQSAREVAQQLRKMIDKWGLSLSGGQFSVKPLPTTGRVATLIGGGLSRREWILGAGGAALGLGSLGFYLWERNQRPTTIGPARPVGEPIRVGLLFSQQGTTQPLEKPVSEMVTLLFEEINANGGLLGHPIEMISRDGASNERIFAREAERLLKDDRVQVIFGCWSSSSRRTVKPIIEANQSLLIYPSRHEGMERSNHILYTGPCPNQLLMPTIDWAMKSLKKRRFALLGSDFIYSHAAHAVLTDAIEARNGSVVFNDFLPLSAFADVNRLMTQLKQLRGTFDAILNTVTGTANINLYGALHSAGFTPTTTPVIAFGLDEQAITSLDPPDIAGHYVAGNYVSTLDSPLNLDLTKRYQARWGEGRAITDSMASAYAGVQLWLAAVKRAESADPTAVRRALSTTEFDGIDGPGIRLDEDMQHVWKYFRVSEITPDRKLKIVENTGKLIAPEVYPTSRSAKEWEEFLQARYQEWGGSWANRAN
ncbi:bifunctional serine/threonine-protein kinase/ABC transporter substrate-binding protein [Tuwongella immobilis]|uniref:Protein kinase domain-containing protein n=1 Tax=Tuwongella immobilis TaxID=692036 RepID=A0A6C2YU91_9BACT|nr:bifunctional serine/threonine-protein kinase/ABC transporter substrate-binding protein [Tuwongella immobilis]VIP04951.1 abc transporter substrate-binding protein : Urea/short-chain amide ABC transporter, periplasmic urea/short-chain amide-binding protein OS=Rhodopirellula sallentina SM41 GN=RSSM_05980 PE=4 SV=1: Pkinase: Peripla_BP_5 [Tuwongella immobilis]VTS07260.1 abc transporter substrate-binding protein : Urea/short-chain amide ABC transporter, periplasmic urea/short-chain amide-binding pr